MAGPFTGPGLFIRPRGNATECGGRLGRASAEAVGLCFNEKQAVHDLPLALGSSEEANCLSWYHGPRLDTGIVAAPTATSPSPTTPTSSAHAHVNGDAWAVSIPERT
jgi:hypothetical protein